MEYSKECMPIRVVDIAGTIDARGGVHFVKPEDWSFHVISHTWSKDVRDFSSKIGKSIGCTSINYNQAFEEADFSITDGYRQLLDFCMLLQRVDGVRYIWFDALCINQVDSEEKSREITHMGAYYANSQGCYVLMHGLGRGFELWKPAEEELAVESGAEDHEAGGMIICNTDTFFKEMYERRGKGALVVLEPKVMEASNYEHLIKLPRWFRRVWTFQEFLLPKKLIFLVGGLSESVKTHLNRRIFSAEAGASAVAGFCKCCLPPKEFVMNADNDKFFEAFGGVAPTASSAAGSFRSMPNYIDVQLDGEDEICSKCSSKALIRKAADELYLGPWETAEDPAIYFVDREAHLCLARLNNVSCREVLYPLLQLYSLLDDYKPVDVVSQIASRSCSNDEDRILSILGLLGAQLNQLRTNRTLEEQILHVVEFCRSNHHLVLQLCSVDGRGYHRPGMSWAPNFRCNDSRFPHVGMDDYVPGALCSLAAHVVSCESPEGVLTLNAKLATGPLIDCGSTYMILLNDLPAAKQLVRLYATVMSSYHALSIGTSVKVATVHEDRSGPHMQKDTLGELHLTFCREHGRLRFQLWAILLGEVRMFKEVRKLAMACVGLSAKSLHKIGLLALPLHVAHRVFPEDAPATLCCVGGFGRYLDDYIFEMPSQIR